MSDGLIDVAAAWNVIERELAPLGVEHIPLAAAVGRVLQAAVVADRDYPPFFRSAMDGFAVQCADVASASRARPVLLRVLGESAPGSSADLRVVAGSAARIMTGAPLPSGSDCIVPVENTAGFEANPVAVYAPVSLRQHVAARGSESTSGTLLLRPGKRLNAADVGVLATVGVASVAVGRRARGAVLGTGNELVAVDGAPSTTQIRNSNSPMLQALAQPYTESVHLLGVAADRLPELECKLAAGLEAEVLLVTGGVSMGVYDLVASTLRQLGVTLHFQRVALQPGKPVTFGTHARGCVLALPGNPVSALTTFRLFGTTAFRRLEGEALVRPSWSHRRASFAWQRRHAKWLVLPGRLCGDSVELVPYTGSGDLLAYAHADCQVILPTDIVHVRPGEGVLVLEL